MAPGGQPGTEGVCLGHYLQCLKDGLISKEISHVLFSPSCIKEKKNPAIDASEIAITKECMEGQDEGLDENPLTYSMIY